MEEDKEQNVEGYKELVEELARHGLLVDGKKRAVEVAESEVLARRGPGEEAPGRACRRDPFTLASAIQHASVDNLKQNECLNNWGEEE
eukprot:324619-Hanusia_phi.AAC.2